MKVGFNVRPPKHLQNLAPVAFILHQLTNVLVVLQPGWYRLLSRKPRLLTRWQFLALASRKQGDLVRPGPVRPPEASLPHAPLLIPRSNKSFTFPFEHRRNIARIALSPQGTLLLTVDEGWNACAFGSSGKLNVCYQMAAQFSPTFSDGRYSTISTLRRRSRIYNSPPMEHILQLR